MPTKKASKKPAPKPARKPNIKLTKIGKPKAGRSHSVPPSKDEQYVLKDITKQVMAAMPGGKPGHSIIPLANAIMGKRPPPPPPKAAAPAAKALPAWANTSGFWNKPQPRPPVATNEPRALNTFREGDTVNIPGLPDMQKLHIERISQGGVTVSGGKLAPSTVLSGASPAVLYYERPADAKGPGLTVVVPTPGHGDFSSMPAGGTVRKAGSLPPPPLGMSRSTAQRPPPPPRASKPGAPREGVCAFIDDLIINGGTAKQGLSKDQILEKVLAKFPDRDPKKTLSTIGIRPTHIRSKGLTPRPFAK